MRIIVCGSRGWFDYDAMDEVLRELPREGLVIVHGGAGGADRMANTWAEGNFVPVEVYLADWSKHGRSAGAIRNQEMLDSGVSGVVAFSATDPPTPGTAHMCRIAMKGRLPVLLVTPRSRQRWRPPIVEGVHWTHGSWSDEEGLR